MTRAALARYNRVCADLHENAAPADLAATEEAWAALPLRTRLRVIFTVPWRDAVVEVVEAVRRRS